MTEEYLKELSKEGLVQLIEIERDKLNFYFSLAVSIGTGIVFLSFTKELNLIKESLSFALIVAGCFTIVFLVMLRFWALHKIKEILSLLKKNYD